jgi:ankyrin repeat protein
MTLGRRAICSAALGVALAPMQARAGAYDDYFRAIELDNGGAVRTLLERGFDPDTRDPKGEHGLYLALRGGAGKAFAALMLHPRIDVDAVNAAGETPLMMAALRANLEAMRQLIARGASVQREGWTPLHYAASSPSVEPVTLLLGLGARVNVHAPNGNTPLMLAARWGHEDSVALLLRHGADRRLTNQRGLDAAAYARLDGREAVARRLEAAGP